MCMCTWHFMRWLQCMCSMWCVCICKLYCATRSLWISAVCSDRYNCTQLTQGSTSRFLSTPTHTLTLIGPRRSVGRRSLPLPLSVTTWWSLPGGTARRPMTLSPRSWRWGHRWAWGLGDQPWSNCQVTRLMCSLTTSAATLWLTPLRWYVRSLLCVFVPFLVGWGKGPFCALAKF